MQKSRYEITVDLIKAIAWPLLLLGIIVFARSPLLETIEAIPQIIKESDTITIGDLKLEIQNGIRIKPNAEISDILSKLDSTTLIQLIDFSASASVFTTDMWESGGHQEMKELLRLGLVELDTSEERLISVLPTNTGKLTREYLVELTIQLANRIE